MCLPKNHLAQIFVVRWNLYITPDRTLALHSLEMIDVLPLLVAPSPCAALHAEHKRHDHVHQRHEHQQGNIGVVANAPNPIEEECAPVPTVQFGGNNRSWALARCVLARWVFHDVPPVDLKTNETDHAGKGLRKVALARRLRRDRTPSFASLSLIHLNPQ